MTYYILTLHLHPSIPSAVRVLEGEVAGNSTLLEGVLILMRSDKHVSELLIVDDDIRAGYLLISEKVELRTTKRLFSKIGSDTEIRIIPISHGG